MKRRGRHARVKIKDRGDGAYAGSSSFRDPGFRGLLGASQAEALAESQYPDWKGQWLRTGRGNGNAWDPTKPLGLGEQAPLIPEYQAMLEAAVADEKAGGQGIDPTYLWRRRACHGA